jgi:adenine-specific DNA-methyltransferase
MNKASGSYYTPDALADFLLSKALNHFAPGAQIKALEPSCGDGAIIRAMDRSTGKHAFVIDAVELNKEAIEKARALEFEKARVVFHKADFLSLNLGNQFQLGIGNPPYIKRKLLPPKERAQCREIHTKAGLQDRTINNIWTAFIIKSAQLLAENGVLAFVLPAELLQVKFAKEIQSFLKLNFARIEIYTFREIVFEDLGQDIIVLVATKTAKEPGIYFGQVDNLAMAALENQTLTRSKAVETSDMKWSGHVLSDDDAEFLLGIAAKTKAMSHYCSSCVGIVTAANNFFVVSKEVRREFELGSSCKPIVQRGQFVNGKMIFDRQAFDRLVEAGKPCYLLDVTGKKLKELSKGTLRYINKGRTKSLHKRFKCTKRTRWYDVPSVWSSHAFFFKRSHLYPKLLLNEMDVLVTDAAYRITVNDDYSVNSLVFSFYNSLTLAMAEIGGRFYGGGVLELTPNEFKSLPLPYLKVTDVEFAAFKSRFNQEGGIERTLELNDEIILRRCFNLNADQIARLQTIRKKLVQRRLRGGRALSKRPQLVE